MGYHQILPGRAWVLMLFTFLSSASSNSDTNDVVHRAKNNTNIFQMIAQQTNRLKSRFGEIGPVMNLTKDPLIRPIIGPAPIPEQIHLSYGNDSSQMVVIWSTPVGGPSKVMYGLDRRALSYGATAQDIMFTEGNPKGLQSLHRAILTGLLPGKHYYYKVQTGDQLSDVYTFAAMNDSVDWSPKFLVFGDMGRNGGAQALRILKDAAVNGSVDAIIHVGDFAYDLDTDGGKIGDEFMNRLQPIATKLPYMTCPGNHEIPHNFSHYLNRFSMPGMAWPMDKKRMWFSFNIGKVHFVSYSTEVYFTDGPIEEQHTWLVNDLKNANKPENRALRPWIIAYGHRPMYCSNFAGRRRCVVFAHMLRKGLENIFYTHGVDLIFEAHEHSYERMWPVYNDTVHGKSYLNPTAPVHIVSASAGCNELDGLCLDPIFGPRGDWSAFRAWLPGLHGVGKLHIANATHVHWQQILAKDESVMDDIWIEQHQHGPFSVKH